MRFILDTSGSRYHFREVFRTGRFAAGNFIISAFDAKPSMAFAMPIMDADNRITGAIGAVVTMDRYAVLFENFSLPEDATLGILDMDGVRMFFYPPKETSPIGVFIKASVWTGMQNHGDSDILVDTGGDGIERFYAYKKLRLAESDKPYMYIVYTVSTAASNKLSNSILFRNLMLMLIVAVLAMSSAVLFSRRLFGARLARILATTARMQEGDFGARVGLGGDRSDLGRIAGALDGMAETIGRRNADMADYARRLEASLAEKEILLREVHHRVKNNFQLIMSLFSLEDGEHKSPAEFKASMEGRVKSMSMVHEMLYESDNLGGIELGPYTRRLVDLLSYATPRSLRVEVEADSLPCGLDTAIPFGLLLNELVVNAFKHAFEGRSEGRLRVSLAADDGWATLEVEDDGPGLPAGFLVSESSSLGLRLSGALAEQLGGTLAWNSGPGARFTLRFKTARVAPEQE